MRKNDQNEAKPIFGKNNTKPELCDKVAKNLGFSSVI
jgi:hypothetical protein